MPIHCYNMTRHADVSLLFDFFVTSQKLRRVLADGLEESGMRPDEYAVYSLLLESGPLTATEMAELMGMPLTTVLDYLKEMTRAGHLVRTSHPFDGRAVQLNLNRAGLAAQRRANRHWEIVRRQIEENLSTPIATIRKSLRALDDSAELAARRLRTARARAVAR
jgi:DNA-binding MarR family transcriptional regulator